MIINILVPDNAVSIDGEIQHFDLTTLVEETLWAMRFDTVSGVGEVEYDDEFHTNEKIISIEPFQPIIDLFEDRKTLVKEAAQVDLDEVVVIYENDNQVTMTLADANTAGVDFIALTLEQVIELKITALRKSFENESLLPVEVDSNSWNGGQESVIHINNKIISTEFNGDTNGELYNIDNNAVPLTVAEMKTVSVGLSTAFEVLFAKFQQKKADITLCSPDITCISNISW